MSIVNDLIDWSEVWAPLIPLTMLLIYRVDRGWKKPLLIYLLITFLINFTIDFLYHPYIEYKLMDSNYIFYNTNSLVRFFFFAWFFNFTYPFLQKVNRIGVPLFALTTLVNFIFLESFLSFSSKMMAIETAIMLIYCMCWFNLKIKDEHSTSFFADKMAWIVIGISFYSAINFILFLFYKFLIESDSIFAYYIWDVHNISFVVLCILFAIGFKKNERIPT